mmetsp:Transcript_117505/g.339718  ORF Transcript_117505/g.339718 Transcript_117505/m.339718 type:complete len:237 (+) Transcript_117505:1754-2464(+)
MELDVVRRSGDPQRRGDGLHRPVLHIARGARSAARIAAGQRVGAEDRRPCFGELRLRLREDGRGLLPAGHVHRRTHALGLRGALHPRACAPREVAHGRQWPPLVRGPARRPEQPDLHHDQGHDPHQEILCGAAHDCGRGRRDRHSARGRARVLEGGLAASQRYAAGHVGRLEVCRRAEPSYVGVPDPRGSGLPRGPGVHGPSPAVEDGDGCEEGRPLVPYGAGQLALGPRGSLRAQ